MATTTIVQQKYVATVQTFSGEITQTISSVQTEQVGLSLGQNIALLAVVAVGVIAIGAILCVYRSKKAKEIERCLGVS